MTQIPRKLSEIMKEMGQRLLKPPEATASSEAIHVALMFAKIAWNETVGFDRAREGYRPAWDVIEAENPAIWNEFKTNDIDRMIDELVQYKREQFPEDRRRILICGMVDGKVRVEWLPSAASGVDSQAEMRLYGLVSVGDRQRAIQFLQDRQQLSQREAEQKVENVARELDAG